ncbi:hypothetical protein Vadar_001421 [Vaccinium darrowii]|uniref:Uncharacterized protein n=1 Tax=Vaccinium darrowii TaxID=229202 RepID=A0ACB7YIB8_9ERIC|nr:hypothetical protein Vadar_001421 [Vaccinium darrowii]
MRPHHHCKGTWGGLHYDKTALMELSLPLRASIKATLLPSSSSNETQLMKFYRRNISSTRSAMAFRIKTSLLLFLFLLISSVSSGKAEGFKDNAEPIYSLRKGSVQMNLRKLLVTLLDYDYTGPNPKHDPRRGKPGKNP